MLNPRTTGIALLLLSTAAACVDDEPDRPASTGSVETTAAAGGDTVASAYGGDETLTPEALERGRLDESWRAVVQVDSTVAVDAGTNPERWEDITPGAVNTASTHLPLGGDVAGPSVFRVQILLDRTRFSPGILDGKWGKNTEKAVYWFQEREGLPATGLVDQQTFQRLQEQAGRPDSLVVQHRLTAEEVQGPFEEIPEDIYEKAEMERMYYESLQEKLSELFHTAPELLQQLNAGTDLNTLQAGAVIQVPNLPPADTTQAAPTIARLVISDAGHYLHALDSLDRIVYHFPSTLGSSYDPSPSGSLEVTSITEDPWWHYQPALLADVDDSEEEARIPPGPNNAVGSVWMALSKPHYGIHGTSAPETIGYATSAGCVRLTNWDALFLARRIRPGMPVEFRDTSGGPPS